MNLLIKNQRIENSLMSVKARLRNGFACLLLAGLAHSALGEPKITESEGPSCRVSFFPKATGDEVIALPNRYMSFGGRYTRTGNTFTGWRRLENPMPSLSDLVDRDPGWTQHDLAGRAADFDQLETSRMNFSVTINGDQISGTFEEYERSWAILLNDPRGNNDPTKPDALNWQIRITEVTTTAHFSGKAPVSFNAKDQSLSAILDAASGTFSCSTRYTKRYKIRERSYIEKGAPPNVRYEVEKDRDEEVIRQDAVTPMDVAQVSVKIEGIQSFDPDGNGSGQPSEPAPDHVSLEASCDGYLPARLGLGLAIESFARLELSGRVLDDARQPVANATVISSDASGVRSTSDVNGQYQLTIKGTGSGTPKMSRDLRLQRLGLLVEGEKGPSGGPLHGVVADGVSTLTLNVKALGIRPQDVMVRPPSIGALKAQSPLGFSLVLNQKGEGVIEYVPPDYLDPSQLTREVTTRNIKGAAQPVWAAVVPLEFEYEDESGNLGTVTFEILVYRPPVMLIHGFTGDETTWLKFGSHLWQRKTDAIIREYYKGPIEDSTIEAQAKKLEGYINHARYRYEMAGAKMTRVDVVAHSMGGLITRYYISQMPRYGPRFGTIENDIRKLIMVGTPNHGATTNDELIGKLSAAYGAGYHQVASTQLYEGSEFFTRLNAGERYGRHLDPRVEYALIYGKRRLSARYDDMLTEAYFTSQLAADDGVVRVTSAELNGVDTYPYPVGAVKEHGYIHSPIGVLKLAFPGDVALTEAPDVFSRIEDLLSRRIQRVPLRNSYVQIRRVEGDVAMGDRYGMGWSDVPPISPGAAYGIENRWNKFKTYENGRITIGFFIDGTRWGTLHLEPGSQLSITHASPNLVEVLMLEGKARFYARNAAGKPGGEFRVAMGAVDGPWHTFSPKARFLPQGTDFIVEAAPGSPSQMYVLDGNVIAVPEAAEGPGDLSLVAAGKGVVLEPGKPPLSIQLPETPWWQNPEIELTSGRQWGWKRSWLALRRQVDEPSQADWRAALQELQPSAWSALAFLAVIFALLTALLGHRFHRWMLASLGFTVGAAAGVFGLLYFGQTHSALLLGVGLVGGIVGAGVGFFVLWLTIFGLGAGVAVLVLNAGLHFGGIGSFWWATLLAAVLGGVVALTKTRPTIILFTSGGGAVLIAAAVPILTGQMEPRPLLWQHSLGDAYQQPALVWIWVLAVILFVVTAFIQFRYTGLSPHDHVEEEKHENSVDRCRSAQHNPEN